MEAVSTLQTMDHRWPKLAKPSKRVSNRTNHRSLYPKPSNGRADHLFADPASADPYSLLGSDLNNPYAKPPPRSLLPLPSLPSKPYNLKALSYPPPKNNKSNKRPNNYRSSSSLTMSSPHAPKKSSPKPKHRPKKDQHVHPKESPVVGSMGCLGPDPGELPRSVFVSTMRNSTNLHSGKQEAYDLGVEFSCPFVYSSAPLPSSLPLPRFALRPKLGCYVAAAAVGVSSQLLHPPSVKTNE